MDELRAVKWFVRLADLGSFTLVADQEGVSKSMVSKEIARLEEHLGVRLLHRSTRNLQLTHIGEGYLLRAKDIVEKLEDAEEFVLDNHQSPRGKLKINMPMVLGITTLSSMFAEFMQQYPDIELDLHLNDDDVDLVEQGFDLGFRASSRSFDSSYVGKPLTSFNYHVCASRDYVAKHPAIKRPEDLKAHSCFVYRYFKGNNVWPFNNGEGVAVESRVKVNNVLFMKELVKQGLGIGFLPSFACDEELADGTYTELLADHKKPQLTLYALYPARQFVPNKTLVCINFIEQWFAQSETR